MQRIGAAVALLATSSSGLQAPARQRPAQALAATTVEAENSQALPWAKRPAGLDELREAEYAYALTAGDFGFDPLGWAEIGWGLNEGESRIERDDRIYAYREAEVKHGRIAMLAAVGWPISELYDGRLSERLGMKSELVNPDASGIGLAPSLLNGGLGQVTLVYWAAIVAGAAVLEAAAQERLRTSERVGVVRPPGDLGFDPLGLYPRDDSETSFSESAQAFDLLKTLESKITTEADAEDALGAVELDEVFAKTATPARVELTPLRKAQRNMIQQELTHGRTAMLAIVGFAAQEAITKVPVVEETPQFFIPNEDEIQAEIEIAEVSRVSLTVLADVFNAIFGKILGVFAEAQGQLYDL